MAGPFSTSWLGQLFPTFPRFPKNQLENAGFAQKHGIRERKVRWDNFFRRRFHNSKRSTGDCRCCLLGWPLKPFEECQYIGSLITAIRDNLRYPRGLPSLEIIEFVQGVGQANFFHHFVSGIGGESWLGQLFPKFPRFQNNQLETQGSALKSCSSWKALAQPTSSTNSMISKQNLQSPADCLEMVEILETSGPTNYSHLVTKSRKKSVQKLASELFPLIRVEPKRYPNFFAQDTCRSMNSTVCEKICGITFFVWNRWNVEECLKFGSGGLGFMLPSHVSTIHGC